MFSKLTQPCSFTAKREGSWDRTGGNLDLRTLAPGGTLVLADLEGPGKIVHWWCTIAGEVVEMFNRMLVLRFYWDDEETPSVEAPIGDFFGSGHGIQADCISLPITSVHGGTGRNCWFEMPFQKRAKLTVTNEADKEIRSFYWNIDWQKYDSLPADTMYFHARYRQEYPTTFGKDYTILETAGKGHYVGVTLNIEKALIPGWFGEGDEKIYIDGEEHPSIWGTGTEDYFLTAWSPHVYHTPFAGFSISQGINHPGDKTTAYRFHVLDPIPFTESIRVNIEHAWTVENKEFADYYSSVAYWYQDKPQQKTAPQRVEPFPGPTERRARWPETVVYDDLWKNGDIHKGF